MSYRNFFLVYFLFLFALPNLAQQRPIVVVIDPGHGGKDPGRLASSSKYKSEKHLALIIAKKLGNYIENNIQNVEVLYTRTSDVFVSLEARMEFANQNKADYFLSIHCNASVKSSVYGTSTHIHSFKLKESAELARMIENDFATRAGRKSRGIFDASKRGHNLYVVQYADMPSVLVEVGFLTNPNEEKYINSDEGQSYLASAIYRAFRDFLKKQHPIEDRSTIYRIQVMASEKPVYLNSKKFQDLDMRVEEIQFDGQKYKYKYYVGREYDMESVNKLLKEVQGLGFRDAFVVKFKK